MLKLSILVPAYNEEGTVLQILARIRETQAPDVAYEVIVIDDGSVDRTGELLRSRPDLYDRLELAALGPRAH